MFNKFSKRAKDSIAFSGTLIGLMSTVSTILGYSLGDLLDKSSVWTRLGIVMAIAVILVVVAYVFIGWKFRNTVTLTVRNTPVEISCGDIFAMDGLRVIGCDTHFDTRVDDTVISKSSLHGQLVLNHGNVNEIKDAVEKAAKRLHLEKDSNGFYSFPLGSIVKYTSNSDGKTYLMLAMTKLNENYEAHTNMAEIDRVYASETVVLPLLGTGISRFDDGIKDKANLLRCMLCTMNASGVSLNCKVKIVIYGDAKNIPLYEYKDLF